MVLDGGRFVLGALVGKRDDLGPMTSYTFACRSHMHQIDPAALALQVDLARGRKGAAAIDVERVETRERPAGA